MIVSPVRSGRLIDDEILIPGDKSISHRAMMFAGLSDGECTINGFLPSEDCEATMRAMRSLGVSVEADSDSDRGFGITRYRVKGREGRLQASEHPIDCGNSGTHHETHERHPGRPAISHGIDGRRLALSTANESHRHTHRQNERPHRDPGP